ncbi:MAG: hypothetical protein QOE51_4070 [Actinoplanes sp.]|nr:hypothetical protein [Actinoplanes sp.]
MAAALVAGQAVLCAVIGWVTFDGREPARSIARAADPQLAPALVVSPVAVAPMPMTAPGRPGERPATKAPAGTLLTGPSTPETAGLGVLSSPGASPPHTATRTPAGPHPSWPSSGRTAGGLIPTARPSDVFLNVVIGEKCARKGADGLTVAKITVRCERDRSGDLVWQIS